MFFSHNGLQQKSVIQALDKECVKFVTSCEDRCRDFLGQSPSVNSHETCVHAITCAFARVRDARRLFRFISGASRRATNDACTNRLRKMPDLAVLLAGRSSDALQNRLTECSGNRRCGRRSRALLVLLRRLLTTQCICNPPRSNNRRCARRARCQCPKRTSPPSPLSEAGRRTQHNKSY